MRLGKTFQNIGLILVAPPQDHECYYIILDVEHFTPQNQMKSESTDALRGALKATEQSMRGGNVRSIFSVFLQQRNFPFILLVGL